MKYFQNQNIGVTLENEYDDTNTDECEEQYEDQYSGLDYSPHSYTAIPDTLTQSQVSNAASSQSQTSDMPSSQSQTSYLPSSQSQSSYVPSSLGRDSEVLEDYIADGTVIEIYIQPYIY